MKKNDDEKREIENDVEKREAVEQGDSQDGDGDGGDDDAVFPSLDAKKTKDEILKEVDREIKGSRNDNSDSDDDNDSDDDDDSDGDQSTSGDQGETGGAEKKTDDVPVLSEALIRKAVAAGLPERAARGFDSDDDLLSYLDKAPKPKAEDGDKEEDEKEELSDEELMKELGLEGYDATDMAVKALLRQQREIIALKQEREKTSKQDAISSEHRKRERAFEDFVRDSAGEFGEVFGDKDLLAMSDSEFADFQKTDQFKNRAKVFEKAALLRNGYLSVGKEVDDRSLFREAAFAALGDNLNSIARKNIAKQLKNRKGKTIAHAPASGSRSVEQGDAAAEAAMDKIIQERNIG